jgi:hypothetical protein
MSTGDELEFPAFPVPQKKAPRKPGAGRNSSLTLERLVRIADLLSAGNYTTTACRFAGLSESTFNAWRRRGELEADRVSSLPGFDPSALMGEELADSSSPDERMSPAYMWDHRPSKFRPAEWPFVVFVVQTDRARAAAEARMVNVVQRAALGGNWTAAAWFLERTAPERFGRRDKLGLEGPTSGSPVQVQHEHVITVDDLSEALDMALESERRPTKRQLRARSLGAEST